MTTLLHIISYAQSHNLFRLFSNTARAEGIVRVVTPTPGDLAAAFDSWRLRHDSWASELFCETGDEHVTFYREDSSITFTSRGGSPEAAGFTFVVLQ
jgi:hypothetical protein